MELHIIISDVFASINVQQFKWGGWYAVSTRMWVALEHWWKEEHYTQ